MISLIPIFYLVVNGTFAFLPVTMTMKVIETRSRMDRPRAGDELIASQHLTDAHFIGVVPLIYALKRLDR